MSSERARSRAAEPHLFIVFGGTGDLMQTKLLPALWRLAQEGTLEQPWKMLAVARGGEHDDESYRQWAREAVAGQKDVDETAAESWCCEALHYQSLGEQTPEDFAKLAERVETLEREHGLPGNRVFYLAIPPQSLSETVKRLGEAGLDRSPGWTRVVIEKPFGWDYDSAVALDADLKQFYTEEQIYRIDHYLGKEAVQNLLVFRFANLIFESLWNRERIASVQITVAESSGAEGRAKYYEKAGVLRDMMQNHLTQLLSLTAMEIPVAVSADAVRDEKAKVLRSIQAIDPAQVVLGQYAAGEMGGQYLPGYRDGEGVRPDSDTPTFAALEARIDNWRWQGVPFYLRTGKRLPANARQIVVNFRCPVLALFDQFPNANLSSNALIITIEPEEGFELLFEIKVPGDEMVVQTQRLRFRYDDVFERLPEAYEALLLDLMHGSQTLFVRIDEVLEAWRLFTPLLEAGLPVHPYPAGTWGPPEANRLTVPTGAACVL